MKVGDIITYAYSYNARYPQFGRITKVSPTGKSIWFDKLGKSIVEDDGYGQNGTCVANPDVIIERNLGPYRVKASARGEYVKVDGHYAGLWDGTPEDFYTD